jgi:hypothetical protein
MPKIVRRLSSSPRDRGCERDFTCPDIFQLDNGEIGIIGRKAEPRLLQQLSTFDAAMGEEEVFVVIKDDLYRSSVPKYSSKLPWSEFLALLWAMLERFVVDRLGEAAESVRCMIAVWRIQMRPATAFG